MKLILASASPRRMELLRNITEDFVVIPSDAEEIIPDDLSPEKAPAFLSKIKALAIAKKHPESLVIGADTGVFIDGEMLGKPADKEDARKMLSRLSGRTHKVITGCTVCKGDATVSFSQTTLVTFFELSKQDIEDYISTSEPYDKAGAYGIQGKGCLLVEKIEGDYFNVVGLPVAKITRKLKEFLKQSAD